LIFSGSSSASSTLDALAEPTLDAMVSPCPTATPERAKMPIPNETAHASLIKPAHRRLIGELEIRAMVSENHRREPAHGKKAEKQPKAGLLN
jgi:hypothetical protein